MVAGRLRRVKWFEQSRLEKIWGKLLLIIVATTDLANIRQIFPKVFALSVLVQLSRCLLFLSLYRSLGTEVSYTDCVTIIPLVYVVILIPVSVAGLGVREGALVYMFKPLGVAAGASISVGLLSHALQVVIALPGFLFWFFDRKQAKIPDA